MAANSRFAQPHRARLSRNRSETRLEHFANSDSEVGPSGRRVEIASIKGVRSLKKLVLRAKCFVIPNTCDICGSLLCG